jgi:hypothetical protein
VVLSVHKWKLMDDKKRITLKRKTGSEELERQDGS